MDGDGWDGGGLCTPEAEEAHDRALAAEIAEFVGLRAQSFTDPDRRQLAIRTFDTFCRFSGRPPILALAPPPPQPEYEDQTDLPGIMPD